jgi:hypothetical protein
VATSLRAFKIVNDVVAVWIRVKNKVKKYWLTNKEDTEHAENQLF